MKNFKFIIHSLLIVTSVFILYSCNNNPMDMRNNYFLITSITGHVNNLQPNARILKAKITRNNSSYIIVSDTIGFDNTFRISLTDPPEEFLIDIDNYISSQTNNLIISDHDAKVNSLKLHVYDSMNIFQGAISKDNHIGLNYYLFPGFFITSALYCDRNLNISGRWITILNSDTTILNYNAALGKGWNLITIRVKDLRTNFVEHDFFEGEPSGANWYFERLTDVSFMRKSN